ncbi:MAG TPA: BON domain-containing protein [Paenalcaligenes hominis]|uniref:BON domain-containing protein n=1 Tax=Paenalcaligenes hominis TaxID=643674 RepID=A0A9D3ABT4_9BURK|nr:BON domain-containing protein [Paenalcaligenes hominis]NJB65169.1 osmotically-inducible protein OsmY [Paenalcaligenes hominis]GGE56057.1 transporter [Paenalcaligenes hominis]HJH24544.1 BON domain-containing protein [Paenalcaligenes hominis]
MNVTKKIAIALLLGSSVALTAGCSVVRNQETVGEYVDGAAVTAEVKARLANDPDTSAANINVKTIDGGVVQLSGFAKSEREKTRAGEVARSTKGVSRVINDLVVRR